MDERIKQGYHKIYSEMYLIVLILSAASLIINVAFFHKNATQLWLEYVILVGSPIYRLIRIRMLEIVDGPADGWNKVFGIRLAAMVAVITLLCVLTGYFRDGSVNLAALAVFMVPFILMFILAAYATRKLQEGWKKKLENRYKDQD